MIGAMGRLALALLTLILTGCTGLQPTATPVVLFVTATPEPPTPTPNLSPTPVIAPLLNLTLTPRATSTPTPVRLPTLAPTFTPSFTATYTDTPEPTFALSACTLAPQGASPSSTTVMQLCSKRLAARRALPSPSTPPCRTSKMGA